MTQLLANIHPSAIIGPNVIIEPFATIREDVEIGEGTWIGPYATIDKGSRIGKNCKIYQGAVVSAEPQDLKYNGENTQTIIGDNTVIREFVTISKGTNDKFRTEIGKNCLIMAYVHVAHDCIIGHNCILVNAVQLAGHVQVDDFAIIGGTTAVHQFVKIGAHAMISGGSLVRKDVPPFSKAGREPLSYCGVNSVGLRRRGFATEKIHEIQEIYRVLYFKGLNISDALDHIELEMTPSNERDTILHFIRNSERGLMKGYTPDTN